MSTYTAEQMERRQKSKWMPVQAFLAPVQFFIFFISLALIIRFLFTGNGFFIANVSVLIKVFVLWVMAVTGAFWEKDVFGHYAFAKEFWWEDFFSTFVLISHSLYVVGLFLHWTEETLAYVALIAYLTYCINAYQFVRKYVINRKKLKNGGYTIAGDVPWVSTER
jgi:3-vinyl bacteriochlorophyllide hydratase